MGLRMGLTQSLPGSWEGPPGRPLFQPHLISARDRQLTASMEAGGEEVVHRGPGSQEGSRRRKAGLWGCRGFLGLLTKGHFRGLSPAGMCSLTVLLHGGRKSQTKEGRVLLRRRWWPAVRSSQASVPAQSSSPGGCPPSKKGRPTFYYICRNPVCKQGHLLRCWGPRESGGGSPSSARSAGRQLEGPLSWARAGDGPGSGGRSPCSEHTAQGSRVRLTKHEGTNTRWTGAASLPAT